MNPFAALAAAIGLSGPLDGFMVPNRSLEMPHRGRGGAPTKNVKLAQRRRRAAANRGRAMRVRQRALARLRG